MLLLWLNGFVFCFGGLLTVQFRAMREHRKVNAKLMPATIWDTRTSMQGINSHFMFQVVHAQCNAERLEYTRVVSFSRVIRHRSIEIRAIIKSKACLALEPRDLQLELLNLADVTAARQS